MIKATPYESMTRNKKFALEVFKQKNLYLIKDMWFAKFPDTLTQYGHTLIKDGEEFNIADSYICKYKELK